MNYQYEIYSDSPSSFTVLIPCPSFKWAFIRDMLRQHGFSEVGPNGGQGWILSDGSVSITGNREDVERCARAIVARLNLRMFQTGAEVLARVNRGALP